MLKYRLIFGSIMAAIFVAVIVFGGWLDGSLTSSVADDKAVRGTIFCILIALLMAPAVIEFSRLAESKGVKILRPVSIAASILFGTGWYWIGLFNIPAGLYFTTLGAFSFLSLIVYQYLLYGTRGVILNCGGSLLSIVYLGLLSSFLCLVRIEFGVWALLMLIFTIKGTDIGAYTFGRLFGRHKFCPKISPGKTWEGMAGGVVFAMFVCFLFWRFCGIMELWSALLLGFCFAFIGQGGDLIESMFKRDADQKDSSKSVPGFGGILDVIDSPLVAGVFGYLYFLIFF